MTEKGFFGYIGMNVVNPESASHTLQIIPRFYPAGDVLLKLCNKVTRDETSIEVTPVISGGYLYVRFNMTFKDFDDYRITIEAQNEIVYRGKLFATTQYHDTQNYKILKDTFNYEQA